MYSEDPKDWEIVKRSADGIVCAKPCYVRSLQVRSGSGGIGSATLYDGQGASGEEVICITAATSRCARNDYNTPVYFSRGVYVDLSTNADWARVQLHRIKEG